MLWSATGDAPLPEVLDVGAVEPGLMTQTPLTSDIRPTDQLSLRVVTSDLDDLTFSLDFTLEEVPDTGALSFNGTFDSIDEYRADVLADTPCDDPSGKNAAGRILGRVAVGQVIAFVAGLAIAIPVRRYPSPQQPAT